jgi:hypothetical protein
MYLDESKKCLRCVEAKKQRFFEDTCLSYQTRVVRVLEMDMCLTQHTPNPRCVRAS